MKAFLKTFLMVFVVMIVLSLAERMLHSEDYNGELYVVFLYLLFYGTPAVLLIAGVMAFINWLVIRGLRHLPPRKVLRAYSILIFFLVLAIPLAFVFFDDHKPAGLELLWEYLFFFIFVALLGLLNYYISLKRYFRASKTVNTEV